MSPQGSRGGASCLTARHPISGVSVFAFRLLTLRFADFVDRNERQHGKGRKSYHHRGAPSACPAELYGCGKSFRRSNSAQWSRSLSTAWPKRWAQVCIKNGSAGCWRRGRASASISRRVHCRDVESGPGQCRRARRGGGAFGRGPRPAAHRRHRRRGPLGAAREGRRGHGRAARVFCESSDERLRSGRASETGRAIDQAIRTSARASR
jgi:hypothetical protein